MSELLYEELNAARKYNKLEIPDFIVSNLKYPLFPWQEEAIKNFLICQESDERRDHLAFEMATGSGKTMIMAALILHYYEQGYRKFIFFTNQKNIVGKSEDNFANPAHAKYLFGAPIRISGRDVQIKKVEQFGASEDIQIKFTTIQKLYNEINDEREDGVDLDELYNDKIMLIADEAHHLNADTKKYRASELDLNTNLNEKSGANEVEYKGWEQTVLGILKRNPQSVLCEFSATIPGEKSVQEKYKDKIVYKFNIKDFNKSGYAKSVNLIHAPLDAPFERDKLVLQALFIYYYRHQIALRATRDGLASGLENFKGVMLFRSRDIANSREDYAWFLEFCKNIRGEDFEFLKGLDFGEEKSYENARGATQKALRYCERSDAGFERAADWLRENFTENTVIITNSKDNKTKSEKTDVNIDTLLNSLEDKNNRVRAIFTVNRLCEGWDCLNLFDIVRLYGGQNKGGSAGRGGSASETTSEKQLIGRGVRYFPFILAGDETARNKRKFDKDLENELRILEEFYFYSDSEHQYISDIKNELLKDGYIEDGKTRVKFTFKPDFLEFMRDKKLAINKKERNPNAAKINLKDLKRDFKFERKYLAGASVQEGVFESEKIASASEASLGVANTTCAELFERHIFLKALNILASESDDFKFENLRAKFGVKSADDLLRAEILGDLAVVVVSEGDAKPSAKWYLERCKEFLREIMAKLNAKNNEFKGGEFKFESFGEIFKGEKEKNVKKDEYTEEVKSWQANEKLTANSYEKKLIEFIGDRTKDFGKYDKFYLLRNEEIYKIYDFESGEGFCPDFLLLLAKGEEFRQILIEVKGEYLEAQDEWKEEFLRAINEKYGEGFKFENEKFRLIGLPFFDKEHKKFEKTFNAKFQI